MGLTHDGWHVWHQGEHGPEIIDTWVEGFTPEEITAMGGYHVVRVFQNLVSGEEYLGFTIYDDRPEEDILEPVMETDEKGSSCAVQPPEWVCDRIRAILPIAVGENIVR